MQQKSLDAVKDRTREGKKSSTEELAESKREKGYIWKTKPLSKNKGKVSRNW